MDKIIELYRENTGQLPLERDNEELASIVSGQPHQVRPKSIPSPQNKVLCL